MRLNGRPQPPRPSRIVVSVMAAAVLTGCANNGVSPGTNEPTATAEATATPSPLETIAPSSPSMPAQSAAATVQDVSGLEGTTVIDRCTVTTEAGCPTVPIATHIVVTGSAGTVASMDTGDDGRFRIPLQPGDYGVHASAKDPGITRPAEANVTVVVGGFVSLTLTLDSGMR